MTLLTADPIFRCFSSVGECPLWDSDTETLLWTDIDGRCLWRGDPARPDALEQIPTGARVGAFGLRRDGDLVLGTDRGFVLRFPGDETIPFPGMGPGVRLNDGKIDPFGHFVCGGTVTDGDGTTGLFRLSADGRVETLLTGIRSANGSCWSPDGGHFYFTDTGTRELRRYAYRPFGEPLGQGELVARFSPEEGWPDGATVDDEGCIWIALWGSGRVLRLAPDGRRIGAVAIGTSNATSAAFGGRDGKTLFISSEGGKLSAEQRSSQPYAGFVFAVTLPIGGPPAPRFG